MNIACIGTGFVGVVTSAVFAKLGHIVTGLDIDQEKIRALSSGKVPFFEPELDNLLKETIASGNLKFTSDYKLAITDADIVFIMVGTPSAPDGQADLKYVFESAKQLAPYIKDNTIIVIKSTVPPGTNSKLEGIISSNSNKNFFVASVPEFLKEGSAVADTLHPDRVVIGVKDKQAEKVLRELHEPLTNNIVVTNPASAQMSKYAANSYLAQRITFINQMANLCEKNEADIEEVIEAIGQDKRIGEHYWYPGLGYGGSCFPKDVKEISAYAKSIGEKESLFTKIDELNESRIPQKMADFNDLVKGFKGKTVAILGLSFKPNTTDTREAPSMRVIPWLIDHGAKVRATDPKAINQAKKSLPASVTFMPDPYQASKGANVIMHLVEWDEYKELDFRMIAQSMKSPKFFIDTRNQYNSEQIEKHNIKYLSIGRS